MNNLQRIALLWEYLTDFDLDAMVYQEEIDNGEAYLDMETEEIYLMFDNKMCKITIEEVGE